MQEVPGKFADSFESGDQPRVSQIDTDSNSDERERGQQPRIGLNDRPFLVLTLCVGMPSGTVCVRISPRLDDAERL
jgi:hypothetical protein